MLRKRSRPVTSPQAIVGDHNNNNSWLPPEKSTKPTSFFLNSPKFIKNFFTSCSSPSNSSTVNDPIMSPTSILDSKPFSAFANTFWVVDNNKNPKTSSPNSQHCWEQPNNTKGIGLALIDENNPNNVNNGSSETINNNNNISNNSNNTTTKQNRRKLVVFGSQLRIQVPPMPPSSVFPCFTPESPREFGIKTPRNSLWPFGNKDSQVHPRDWESNGNGNGHGHEIIPIPGNDNNNNNNLSLSDMELSEDYTCVISHGPNPKTTHIFGNCIVQSCCGVVGSSSFSSNRNGYLSKFGDSIPSHDNFLSFCHHCKKKLGEGRDIYMYRGEKAFCSQECRSEEMLLDEGEN